MSLGHNHKARPAAIKISIESLTHKFIAHRIQAGVEAFIVHVLDPSLLKVRLVDRTSQLLQKGWHGTNDKILAKLTFRDVNNKAIKFFSEVRPIRRVLNFHARQARTLAISKGWVAANWDFEDFGSEGKISIEKWLNPARLLPPGPSTGQSDSEGD